MSKFVHLHVHTEYSLLDGLSKIQKLFQKAKDYKMEALAITDHGVMYGAINFYTQALEYGIKPIIGTETYIAKKSRFDKQSRFGSDQAHLILLAKNITGYRNLMSLVSIAHLEGYHYKPRIDWEVLIKHKEGLIVTSACLQGQVSQALLENNLKLAKDIAQKYAKEFADDYYLEIQHHTKIPKQQEVNKNIVKISRELGIPLLATNDVHYVDQEDAEAQDALLAIQTRKTIADKNRLTMIDCPDFYLKSQEEMEDLFQEYPDALENSIKIADKCNVKIPIGEWILPEFPLPAQETPDSYLRKLAHENLKIRYEKPSKEIIDRINYELDVICGKGYAPYFLIVSDFVNWSKKNGIRVGPGRGSVAGSLVSYVLRITSMDPIEHSLPFERFLNPHRPTPPDIDLDFADNRRDEVIGYVTKKYGENKVAQIITFGTMEARGSIRDIGRVLGMPYEEPDRIAKLIPLGYSIEEALTSVFELQEYYKQEKYKKLLDLAKKVEGVVRHASTHAAGVVIADKDLQYYTPIQRESREGKIVTQYDMYSLDLNISKNAIGLLKIDFLGLRNLTILGTAIDLVKKTQGKTVDISEISLNEKKVYSLLSQGETTGIFQLESAGMRRVAKNLKPNRFSDITAMVALYRPGPMELINDFIERKKYPEKITFPHPDLKPILEETYGIAVYQEQCLQIAAALAGYTMAEADMLRLAIGKKKASIMNKERKKFIDGAKNKGYSEEIAENVWGYIERFVGYGFNKPHAASYAMIAYQTAYMKAFYPVEFMTALLSSESSNTDKLEIGVEECKRMNIKVLPPNINTSESEFIIEKNKDSLENQAIRFGLSAVKNVGEAAIGEILVARNKDGVFKTLRDFINRVNQQKVNRKVLESLIKVGAMDEFGKRAAMLIALDDIRDKSISEQKKRAEGQSSLFDVIEKPKSLEKKEKLPEIEEFPNTELLAMEKQLLGFYLTDHPMAKTMQIISQQATHKIYDLSSDIHEGKKISLAGIISDVRKVITRKNQQEMAFATLEDGTGKIDLTIFPRIYSKEKEKITKDKALLVHGTLDLRNERLSLAVDDIQSEEALISKNVTQDSKEQIILVPKGTPREKLKQVSDLLKNNKGEDQILIKIPNGEESKLIKLPYTVDYSSKLRKSIKNILS